MSRREEGFTLIEIMVVITIIAVLASMVTLVIPMAQEAQKKATCQNNLKQIGGVLAIMNTANKMKRFPGAPFILQVKDTVDDADLEVFQCPGDQMLGTDPNEPDVGTQEFYDLYRNLDLKGDVEDFWTSYAGPNWKDFPEKKTGRESRESRLWACDKCRNGAAHHKGGISILYDSTKVGFLDTGEIEGYDDDTGDIIVGQNAQDKRLKQMIFFPPR